MPWLHRRGFLQSAATSLAALAAPAIVRPARAQASFPARPIRLIVPAPPGSRHGQSAALFARSLERAAGVPVTVEHPEGSAALGSGLIAGAGNDGHTIGYATVDLAILHWRGLSDLKPADFVPLARLNEDPAGIHVRADSSWQSARQLLEHVKANPGKLKASSTPAGGIWHLSTVGWLGAVGLPHDALPWIAAAGPAAGVEDMMLGGADVIVCSTPEVRFTPHGGRVRTLAIMSAARLPRFGNVPTVQQATGTAHVAGAWRGLVAPKGTPQETADALTALARKAAEDKELQAQLQRRGYLASFAGGREFGQFMEVASGNAKQALGRLGMTKA
jgi:tripartite-type tricarboxylate transporter receptor subunit TctC